MTRGSKTTVVLMLRPFVAPSMRTERSTASRAAASGSSAPGPRPIENPDPVWVSSADPARVATDRKALVRSAVAEIPVVDTSAISERLSP